MNEVWCQYTCDPQSYFEMLWNLISVNHFINAFIPLWYKDMTYAEMVLSWLPLKLKVVQPT